MVESGRFLRAGADGHASKAPRALEVFLVEDDPEACMEMEDLIRSIGHSVVARAGSIDGAFSSLARLRNIGIVPDVAVIEAEWDKAPAGRLVLALRSRGIPVVVDSGREVADRMPRGWKDEPVGSVFRRDRIREALDTISRFGQARSRPVAIL